MRSSPRLILPAVVGLALLVSAPVSADSTDRSRRAASAVSPAVSVVAPNIIGFESDTTGVKPDGFASVDNPTVHFVDSLAANLDLSGFGAQTNGQGLGVYGDDASELKILLDVPTTRLAILFGNDDVCCTQVGDRATLTVFRNGKRVATRHVVMNRNDIADQTIEYQGRVAIDKATFVYNRAGTPIDLIEMVDDITLAQVCAIKGNNRANKLVGNVGPNGMCGLRGADKMSGHGGNDAMFGGAGPDRMNGNDGNDLIVGGGGNDTLTSADGVFGNDIIYGGPGNDICNTDEDDIVISCENWNVTNLRP